MNKGEGTSSGAFDFTEIRSWINKEQEISENDRYFSEQPVEKSEIRRVALTNCDYNPLWLDEEYACKTRWGGIIAPPLFLGACGNVVFPARPAEIPGADPWTHFYGGCEWEFLKPVRVGDVIEPIWKLVDAYEKAGNFAGPLAFTVGETAFKNQKEEVVGICRSTLIHWSRAAAKKRKKYRAQGLNFEPEGYPENKKGEITARGSLPLYYENVKVNDEIKPLSITLTIPMIVVQSTCYRVGVILPHTASPGAGCYWHYTVNGAKRVREMPAPFDVGIWRPAWFARLMTDWIGDDGWLKKLRIRIHLPIFAGDTTTCRGKVIRKYIENNDNLIDCEIWGENQRGEITTNGSCTVILPSRG